MAERPRREEFVLRPGETIALCRCWLSQKFPYCDGSHKQTVGKGPAIVKGEEGKPG